MTKYAAEYVLNYNRMNYFLVSTKSHKSKSVIYVVINKNELLVFFKLNKFIPKNTFKWNYTSNLEQNFEAFIYK